MRNDYVHFLVLISQIFHSHTIETTNEHAHRKKANINIKASRNPPTPTVNSAV